MKDNMKFTTEEAAAYLGVSERTLENWRATGTGPKYYKPTQKLVYYFQADMDEWIRGRKASSDKSS